MFSPPPSLKERNDPEKRLKYLVAEPDKVLVGELNEWVANPLGPGQTSALQIKTRSAKSLNIYLFFIFLNVASSHGRSFILLGNSYIGIFIYIGFLATP